MCVSVRIRPCVAALHRGNRVLEQFQDEAGHHPGRAADGVRSHPEGVQQHLDEVMD